VVFCLDHASSTKAKLDGEESPCSLILKLAYLRPINF